MAKILENDVKELLTKYLVTVPKRVVVDETTNLNNIINQIQLPWIVKAHVPLGKKGKSGLIKKVYDIEQAKMEVKTILGKVERKYVIDQVLIEECVVYDKEIYLSITYDSLERAPVILFSSKGGVEIEELVKEKPELLAIKKVNIIEGLHDYEARELCFENGLSTQETNSLYPIIKSLYQMFIELDARLLEINPLAISEKGEVYALGAMLIIDDDALDRHPELGNIAKFGADRSLSGLTDREKRVLEVDRAYPGSGAVRYTDFDDGNIAVIVIGGGASLVVMDTIYRIGARPSNYSDLGPGKGVENKFKVLVKEALSKPGIKGLFIGAAVIVAVDIQNLTKIIKQVLVETNFEDLKIPVVARWAGLGDDGAKADWISMPNCIYFGREATIEQAVEKLSEVLRND